MAYDEVCTVINMLPLLMLGLGSMLLWRYSIPVAASYIFCVRFFLSHLLHIGVSRTLGVLSVCNVCGIRNW